MEKLKNEVITALEQLESCGYEAYLVGGAVRDLLLGRKNHDYDITTNADPNAIRMVFSSYQTIDIGKKHGTIIVLINKEEIEITPYRTETNYEDHRHPQEVHFSSDLKEDLKRRDFTINGLCMDKNGEVIDFFGGIDDLNSGIIRCIGNPQTRFNEDALRILRAIRFSAQLAFVIEAETEKQLFANKELLNCISIERKRDELLKILQYSEAFAVMEKYRDIFATFLAFDTDRQSNDFSDPLYALACLCHHYPQSPHQLKLSHGQLQLLDTLMAVTDLDLKDDKVFIEALSSPYQNDILSYLEQLHHLDLKARYQKLKPYMITLNELAIDGRQISSYGIYDQDIGKTKEMLLAAVHSQKCENTDSALRAYLEGYIIISV